jgi:hypothetical protein
MYWGILIFGIKNTLMFLAVWLASGVTHNR